MCPMTLVKTYHALAVRRLPALTKLDGNVVTALDRHHANTRGASISPAVLRAACKFRSLPAATGTATGTTDQGARNSPSAGNHKDAANDHASCAVSMSSCRSHSLLPDAQSEQSAQHAMSKNSDSTPVEREEQLLSQAVEVVLQVSCNSTTLHEPPPPL